MTHRTYLFEGEQLTVNAIKKRIPSVGTKTIKNCLEAGINTAVGIARKSEQYNHVAASRKGKARSPWHKQAIANINRAKQ